MIPTIIHHLWKDAALPERYVRFRRTWQDAHPHWRFRLWTDPELRAFVAAEFPAFLPIYDAYEEPIRRADAARYLVLKRIGGLYVDLDFECLKPVDPLLAGHRLAIGVEPDSHLALDKAARSGLARLLCPSFIASVPEHGFWDHVLEALGANAGAADTLDATGPFLLSRAYETVADPASVTLLPATTVYPADKETCWQGRLFDIRAWERATRGAYALHHWDGTWFRGGEALGTPPTPLQVAVSGEAAMPAAPPRTGPAPLVSCLMATRDRVPQALLAIEGFRRQTYANRELVIVDDGADDTLARAVAAQGDPRVRLVRPGDPATNLGRARNRAVALAAGSHVCQWDDDDLYDPRRLELQMAVLERTGARACLLTRWLVWWPGARRLGVSRPRPWEGSLLAEKAVMVPYPELARGEDTPVVEHLLRTVRVAHLDEPRLYLYVAHGANTFPGAHFEELWETAEPRWEGERFQAVARELAKGMPLAAYARTLAEGAAAKRRWPAAVALFGGALDLAPADAPSRLGRSVALLELGRFAEAEADAAFPAGGRGSPAVTAAAAAVRAEVAVRRRDWPEAERRWHRLLALEPASPRGAVGLATTLVEQGRLDAAAAVAARQDPVVTRRDAVTMRAAVLQRRQDGDGLLALLEAHPAEVAGDPALRTLLFHTLQARGEIARACAAIAAEGEGGGVVRALVDAAYAPGAEARRGLHALWARHGVDIVTPDLLGLVVRAVEEADGEAGWRAVLDAVDALPPTDERTVRLRLLSVFERLRRDPASGPAGPALLRVVQARDPQAPAGHWAEAMQRFVQGFERLRPRFAAFLVDSAWQRAAAEAVVARILDAHRARRPFSLVRLGDGEGNFLPYPARQEAHAGPDRDATQCIWWGAPRLDGTAAAGLCAALMDATRTADVVGVPDLSRLCYGLPLPTPPFLFNSWHDFRGLLVVLHHLAQEGPQALFQPHQTVTSCHIHADLAGWGLYEGLFAALGRVSLITCHPGLAAVMAARFGVTVGQDIRIPHEAKYAGQFGYGPAAAHYPDAFRTLERTLAVREPGEVFLVAAGFLGKMYCARIKALGGIALDVGSVVDHWCGFSTRSLHFTQRFAAAEDGPAPTAPPEPAVTPAAQPGPRGVNLFGHVRAGVGLGVAAAGLRDALVAAGVPVAVVDLDAPPAGMAPAEAAPHDVTIVHTNPDLLAQALQGPAGAALRAGLRRPVRIGAWVWESAAGAPASWQVGAGVFDAIWAPSRFAADCLRRVVPSCVPVEVVPHVVCPPAPATDRAALGLPEGVFLFASLFDGLSGFARKNPLGVVEAFRRAFAGAGEAVALLLRARSLAPDQRARLEDAIAGDPAIHLRVGEVPREDALAHIALCDAYVSLHRAEGFGLTVAEALALGRPVIATAGTGCDDFLSEEVAFPVPARPLVLAEADGPYPAGTEWRDPDLDEAAALMRAVWLGRGIAAAKGRRGAAAVRAAYGPAAVGAQAVERLAAARPIPPVLVLVPVRNARRHLPRLLSLLEGIDHPGERLSLAFLEGDSDDGSAAALEAALPRLRQRFRRVELHRHATGERIAGPRWAPAVQRQRRAAIARARNRLLHAALRGEDWVLWVDADVVEAPADALRRLLATGRDIVVPHCVVQPGGPTFDLNTFRFTDPAGDAPEHMVDGLMQPPRGVGRRYLDAFRGAGGPVPVDGVGGTMLLVRADLHREGLVFPVVPHRGYIETEGLAMLARDMGIPCWGLPDLEIQHAAE